MQTEEMSQPKRTGRLQIGALSEFYEDLLRADSFLSNDSMAGQGKVLLQEKLSEKESKIKERIRYLAEKRKISFEDMWNQIQSGTVQQMSKEEFSEIQER